MLAKRDPISPAGANGVPNVNKQTARDKSDIMSTKLTYGAVATAIAEIETRLKINKLINLTSDSTDNTIVDKEWKSPSYHKNKRRPQKSIIGTQTLGDIALKVAPSLQYIHVTKLATDT